MTDLVIYAGLTVAQLEELREVVLVLRHGLLFDGRNSGERDAMDRAIRRAKDNRLLEYVVEDNWDDGTKTITLYPYLGCPPEKEPYVIRADPAGSPGRHARPAAHAARPAGTRPPRPARSLPGDRDH